MAEVQALSRFNITDDELAHTKPMQLRYWPDPVLHEKCELVPQDPAYRKQLATNLIATMRKHKGVGIAAPQVGITQQLCIVADTYHDVHIIINPANIEVDVTETYWCEEGCLSIPGYTKGRRRARDVIVTHENLNGDMMQTEFSYMSAFIAQHELEHLNGVLFIDGMSRLRLNRITKKVRKLTKNA